MRHFRWTVVSIVVLALLPAVRGGSSPELINYQGVLRYATGDPVTGTPDLIFRLYDTDGGPGCAGGTLLALDPHLNEPVEGGLFNVELGENLQPGSASSLGQAFAGHSAVYVEIQVEGEVLCPRVRVVSAAYALNARYVRGTEIVPDGPFDLYVDADTGLDDNDGLTPDTAKRTIQGAVDALPAILTDIATIRVAAGIYPEEVFVNRTTHLDAFDESAIPIVIEGDPQDPANVLLTGAGVLGIGLSALDTVVAMRGLTIDGFEAGVHADKGTILVLEDCTISNNDTGVRNSSGYTLLRRCNVEDNLYAGIEAQFGQVEIYESSISTNGTGVIVGRSSDAYLVEVELAFNTQTGLRAGPLGSVRCRENMNIHDNDWGAVATDGGMIDFDLQTVTFGSNTQGDMNAVRHGSILNYGNGTFISCTADALSICDPDIFTP